MAQNKLTRTVMPVAVVLAFALSAPAYAQRGGGGRGGGGAGRGGGAVGALRGGYGGYGYRGYGYRGYGGYGYGGYGWGGYWGLYGYPWYGYGYPWYGYPYYGYPAYGYPYGAAAQPYGGLRIEVPQKDAQVYLDGYLAGNVDNFDGRFHHLNLEPGPHRIEIRAEGFEPVAFAVNVEPGQTLTYGAAMRPAQP
jgi:PEGA domain